MFIKTCTVKEVKDHTYVKVLLARQKWDQMEKWSDKTIIKIVWDSIKEAKQYHRNNKLTKIVQALIESLNKEC
jgi:3'-phosphoadenosine 5'-phosphosulfate sulfotransferase